MKTATRPTNTPAMSADAYAGFLKLWLTPTHTLPPLSSDVDAYLRHANEREPIPDAVRGATTPLAKHAA